jgi:hypothetical protein
MTVPSKDLTYIYSANEQILSQNSYAETNSLVLLTMIKRLITMGWACVGSSNGTNYNAIDGLPHSSLLLTVNDLVYQSPGNNHTWIVLENTVHGSLVAGNPQLLIDLNNSDGSHTYVDHYLSLTGSFSGGNVNTAPTALDQVESAPFFDANNHMRPLYTSHESTYNPNARLNIIMSNDGKATYIILCAAGKIQGFWALVKASNISGSIWTNPWVFITVGPAYYDLYNSSFNTNIYSMRFRTVLGAATTPTTLGAITENICYFNDNTRYLVHQQPSYDQETLEYPFCQIGLWVPTSPYIGRKGVIKDLYLGTSNVLPGMTYPNDNSKQWVQVGDFILPWDGSSDFKML